MRTSAEAHRADKPKSHPIVLLNRKCVVYSSAVLPPWPALSWTLSVTFCAASWGLCWLQTMKSTSLRQWEPLFCRLQEYHRPLAAFAPQGWLPVGNPSLKVGSIRVTKPSRHPLGHGVGEADFVSNWLSLSHQLNVLSALRFLWPPLLVPCSGFSRDRDRGKDNMWWPPTIPDCYSWERTIGLSRQFLVPNENFINTKVLHVSTPRRKPYSNMLKDNFKRCLLYN